MSDEETDESGTVMPRATLKAALQTAFPDWSVVAAESVPDALGGPTVILKQRTIARLNEAPLSHYTVGYYVTIADDHTDFELAEETLDNNVLAVWEALMSMSNVHPQTATKAMFNKTYLAYDIEANLTVQKG